MSRRRAITLLGVAGAFLVSAGAAWAARGWFFERWCLFRLRHGDPPSQVAAVEDLGRWGRADTVPDILNATAKLTGGHALRTAAQRAFVAMGPRAGAKLID